MPQKHTIKIYAAESYYHVYTRGVNKQKIFGDEADYVYFETLLDRYLGIEEQSNSLGAVYPNYRTSLSLLSFCLMPNHVHLLLYQGDDSTVMTSFMRSLMTSYSKYFNKKYKRVGALFESRYKAKRIDRENYLIHIGRYIHMNPRRWQTWRHSSLRYVYSKATPNWLTIDEYISDFKGREDYMDFLFEYVNNKQIQEEIKRELADN